MLKYIGILIVGILTSFYFFPFEFAILPGANTKMILAGISLVVLAFQLARGGRAVINRELFTLSILAGMVSLAGLASVTFNETNDYTYATYIISMWVWLGGAYMAVSAMRGLHGRISVALIANYLIGVCVAQCIIALLIDASPAFKDIVNTYIASFDFVQFDQLNEGERLYGIGATLDVAGIRFSTVLAMIAYFCVQPNIRANNVKLVCYLASFCIIAIVGNMIARTTTMGVGLAVLYWLYMLFQDRNNRTILWWIAGAVVIAVTISTYMYRVSPEFRENIRFAFEGFFSLVEKGEWDVNSNNILKDMFILPDNVKTWCIGDGYFDNPYYGDPYYTGPGFGGYYMGTDVGYLRFIFYFGLIGLSLFIYFFWRVAQVCVQRFRGYALLFLMILAVNMIGWFKVSTDIFLVFALFLCVPGEEEDDEGVRRTICAKGIGG